MLARSQAALARLVRWVAALEADAATSGVVLGVEAANEPALGWTAAAEQPRIKAFLSAAVPSTQAVLNATGRVFAAAVNFVGDMGEGMGPWLAQEVASGAFAGGSQLLVDYHYYLNWSGDMTWAQLAARVCGSAPTEWAQVRLRVRGVRRPRWRAEPNHACGWWAQYTAAGLGVVAGEWSVCSNLGAPAFTNISDAGVRAHLAMFFANQVRCACTRVGACGWLVCVCATVDDVLVLCGAARVTRQRAAHVHQMSLFFATPGSFGQYYWALRMGSGWDPRPSAQWPAGRQVPGSAWDTSLPGFGPTVWSLGELIRVGVAAPLSSLAIEGVCTCNGCGAGQ